MELVIGLIGTFLGATSVWAVNFYRAKVDNESAINRQMLVKRLECAETLCSISYKATREILTPKKDSDRIKDWSFTYYEAETLAEKMLLEMWEVIDTYGVYFQEKEYKDLVNIPDLFNIRLRFEKREAERGKEGIEDWDWREAFLEGQGYVRHDVKAVCVQSMDSKSLKKLKKDSSKLELEEQYNKRFKSDADGSLPELFYGK